MIRFFLLLFLALGLSANVAVPGDRYKKLSDEKVEVIYAHEYDSLSQKVLDFERKLLKKYTHSYGYALDDKQYVGLLSSHNQVANAYSTQVPLNLQMNFGAGALMTDYFSARSWIKTLLLHESAHNFQLNPKKNPLSYYTHKVVKNTFLTLPFFVPLFPVPNLAESSFMLEGNAVLNESWHNNGGRLYNGSLLAMAITQARAGYITPERTYNDHLYFPYASHHYIVGGFFYLYLAERFGIDAVNRYFYNFSGQWIPVFTNAVCEETFGEDYERLLVGYNSWLLTRYGGFKASEGEVLFRSKQGIPLSATKDSISFLITDKLSAPSLVEIDKDTLQVEKRKTAHRMGKVYKIGDKHYSQSSVYVDPEHIVVGLYDEEGKILKESASKAVQSFTSKGEMVYFDIPRSFDMPQMYVGGEFYARVNSSVFTDYHDNHYYFVQEGKTRTLYQNKKALFSYQGWYGFVCDVDENGIYFIANSPHGSSIYRYHDRQIWRMSEADDIIDMRLLSGDSALVETIEADGVTFRRVHLEAKKGHVEEVSYFFEDDARFYEESFKDVGHPSHDYHPLLNLHYSNLSQSMVFSGGEIDFDVTANFSDPLSQNVLRLFMNKRAEDTVAGLGYDSSQYRLGFGASLYGVLAKDINSSARDYGAQFYLSYPIMQNSYEKMDAKLSYHISHEADNKEPLTLTLDYKDQKHFGKSMYLNTANDFSLSLGLDRGDEVVGGEYFYQRSFPMQWYLSFEFKAAFANVKEKGSKRGIKVEQYSSRFSNALSIEMPSIAVDTYVQEIVNGGIGLHKVLDIDAYFFSFPTSLRREALYTKYNYYQMQFFNDKREGFHEVTVGLEADLLYFNSLALPLSVEYLYNDKMKNANNFRVLFDLRF